ncbi:AMP-dependent synthetase/ligase [Saccharopolyspora mangrovi]|uniref:Acyl-CoA synthetase n=1 Tax=Saccharopolyspora mangrovi TaxID=3082379 RepID=A0ABU6AIH6_9PSEU|nr:AMP-dependent synthetase/ligase [Saccharopolyspora sp. S2-29]MEB3371364.1 AMP-dependent synthetase/ligase [Saccharopolyspora sp. S2-29]
MHNSSLTHVVQLLDEQSERVPTHPALSWLTQDGREVLTWADYRQRVWAVASGFLDLGVKPGETVAILAPNIVEHYVADLAAILCGAATVSLYPTLVDEQLVHILADAQPVVVIIADVTGAGRIRSALPEHSAARIVCVQGQGEGSAGAHVLWADLLTRGSESLDANRGELGTRLANSGVDDAATYVYTSGTTGMPKGVIVTHANLLFEMEAFDRMGLFVGGYRVVSYLPLAHIAERLWSLYFPLKSGGNVLLCPDQSQLVSYLRLQRPSYFMGVPRVWEKLRGAAKMILKAEPYLSRSAKVAADRDVLAQAWSQSQDGSLGPEQRLRALRAREGILHDLRRDLGLDWTVNPACGAAALPEDLRDFWRSVGVDLTQAYGLSETTGVAVWERIGGASRGSVGFAVPGCEIAIAEDGEILIRGPGNTPGYRNMAPDESGLFVGDWLATGDIGHLDEAGRLHVTDRKKEMIVNASGKNISPTAIEDKISGHGFINQVIAIGDGRPYITGIMTVNEPALLSFATEFGIAGDLAELVEHPVVLHEAQRIVDLANERVSRPEQIKRFRLVADQWSVDSGDLTPTLKLRRRAVLARYSSMVDGLYEQPGNGES